MRWSLYTTGPLRRPRARRWPALWRSSRLPVGVRIANEPRCSSRFGRQPVTSTNRRSSPERHRVLRKVRHAAMLLISARTASVRCSQVGTRTRLSQGMATTRTSGPTANARTSFRITYQPDAWSPGQVPHDDPEHAFELRSTGCDVRESAHGASGANRVALRRGTCQGAHTGKLCANGADPVAVPLSIRRRAGRLETIAGT